MSKIYDEMKSLQAEKGEQGPEPAVVVGQEEELMLPGLGTKKKKKAEKPAPISKTESAAGPKPQPAAASAMDFAPKRRPVSYLLIGFMAGVFTTWSALYVMGPVPVLFKNEPTATNQAETVTVKPFIETTAESIAPTAIKTAGTTTVRTIEASTEKTAAPLTAAASKLLTGDDLQGKTRQELKIMRNEIFARHSYIFTSSQLQEHFKKQPWYSPKHKDVTSMLTEEDKANIELIRSFEKKL